VLFHPNASSKVVVSSDQHRIALYEAGRLSLRELPDGREIGTFRIGESAAAGDCDMAFSPSAHLLAWAHKQSFGVTDFDTGQTRTYPIGGNTWGGAVCFSPDGRKVAFTTAANLMSWDVATATPHPFARSDREVFSLAFSPKGSLLATAHDGGSVGLWDGSSGHLLTNMVSAHPHAAMAVGFSADGRFLATAGSDAAGRIWELAPSGLRLRHTLRGHVGWVNTLCFSPHDRRIVSAGTDATLKIWDPESGLELATLYGHRSAVRGIWFSQDGNMIYSADVEGELRSWPAPALASLGAVVSERPR
jgi:WD40 repeat protein